MKQDSMRLIEGLDEAKGIGIILVVFGHALTWELAGTSVFLIYLRYTVYLLHMPLFFMVSGYLFEWKKEKYQKRGFCHFMLEKARILMLPYIIFSAIAWIVTWMGFQFPFGTALLEGAGYSMKSPAGFLFSLLTYICPVDNHLWFSYVLFLVFLLAFGLMGKPKKIVLPAAYAGYALSFLIPLPELIQKLMRYFFLFQAGTVLYRKERWLDNRRARLIVGPAFAVGFLFFCIFHALNWGEPQILSEPVAEIAGCSLILYIVARLKKGKGMKLLKETGRMSYQIYLLHHPFVVPGLLILLKGRMPVALLLPTVTVLGILIPVAVYRWVFERWSSLNIVCFGGRSRDQ